MSAAVPPLLPSPPGVPPAPAPPAPPPAPRPGPRPGPPPTFCDKLSMGCFCLNTISSIALLAFGIIGIMGTISATTLGIATSCMYAPALIYVLSAVYLRNEKMELKGSVNLAARVAHVVVALLAIGVLLLFIGGAVGGFAAPTLGWITLSPFFGVIGGGCLVACGTALSAGLKRGSFPPP